MDLILKFVYWLIQNLNLYSIYVKFNSGEDISENSLAFATVI